MHRDPELLRRILLNVADHESVRVEGADPAEIEHHARLLEEGGLLEGYVQKKLSSRYAVQAPRLTWAGHEFLDLARSESRWQAARQAIDAVDGASIEIWSELLADLARRDLMPPAADIPPANSAG